MRERILEVKLTLSGAQSYSFIFDQSPVIVGRGGSCELCIPLKHISAQHFSLSWSHHGGLSASDLNAKNKVEHRGAPLIGSVTDPKRLTLSLPGALIEAKLIPKRAHSTSRAEHNHHLRSLWSAAEGWLLEWRSLPASAQAMPSSLRNNQQLTPSLSVSEHTITEPTTAPLKLVPIPFGERLELRASLGNPEGIPASILDPKLSVESDSWGVTVTEASGQKRALRVGEELITGGGVITLVPRLEQDLSPQRKRRRAVLIFFIITLLVGALYFLALPNLP